MLTLVVFPIYTHYFKGSYLGVCFILLLLSDFRYSWKVILLWSYFKWIIKIPTFLSILKGHQVFLLSNKCFFGLGIKMLGLTFSSPFLPFKELEYGGHQLEMKGTSDSIVWMKILSLGSRSIRLRDHIFFTLCSETSQRKLFFVLPDVNDGHYLSMLSYIGKNLNLGLIKGCIY